MVTWATRKARRDLSQFLPPDSPPKPQGVLDAFCRYYEKVKYPRCRPENDGDMLLFQYGVYDWGSGRWFEVSMVRQFIVESWRRHPDYARMEQLNLSLLYPPEFGSEIERFELWSHETDGVADFAGRVLQSPGFRAASEITPVKWGVEHEGV